MTVRVLTYEKGNCAWKNLKSSSSGIHHGKMICRINKSYYGWQQATIFFCYKALANFLCSHWLVARLNNHCQFARAIRNVHILISWTEDLIVISESYTSKNQKTFVQIHSQPRTIRRL